MNTKPHSRAASDDAIAMLVSDHKKVKALFKSFEQIKESGSAREKSAIVAEVCDALTVHAAVEEEIFYPAVRAEIGDDDLMDEALVEHAGAKALIAQLRAANPGDDLYDANVTVLGEQIQHHVKEEEGEMFPKARKAGVDLAELGVRMAARKAQLENAARGGSAKNAAVALGHATPLRKISSHRVAHRNPRRQRESRRQSP